MFGDDQDLRNEMERFKRIVNGLKNVESTAIYQVALEGKRSIEVVGAGVSGVQTSVDGVGSNVKKLVDDQTKRNREDKRKEWLTTIRKSLGIEDDNTSPKPRQEQMAKNRLEGTGNWLLQDDRFTKWANRDHSEGDSILFLTGSPGFGK